jgi:putative CocE/NonD family hydrolase
MSVLSRIAAGAWKLPAATTPRVAVERGMRVPMPDGIELIADRYTPRAAPHSPTVLIRTPYGRRSLGAGLVARLLAERGYQVLLQSTRGTFDSGGTLDPFVHEAADGAATVAWLRRQPWFGGRLATWGASYEGYVQWALAGTGAPELGAVAVQLGGSDMRESFVYPSGVFALSDVLAWARIVHTQSSFLRLVAGGLLGMRALPRAHTHLPIIDADRLAVGRDVPFVRRWLAHPEGGAYWEAIAHRDAAVQHSAPAHLIAGWYDIYLTTTLADYAALRDIGQRVRLVVGPWRHMDTAWHHIAFTEGMEWLDTHLKGAPDRWADRPVKAYVTGHRAGWVELRDWPPPGGREASWHLHPGGSLASDPAPGGDPRVFRYDPTDPTPAIGGLIAFERSAGPRDNRAVESRPDVLTYTSAPLAGPLTVAGQPSAVIHVRSSTPYADIFARLCDVTPDGLSRNVCDGIVRLDPAGDPPSGGPTSGGVRRVTVALSATAHRFAPGNRIRLQVSGGAFPRWARNLGTAEPFATARHGKAVEHEVFHEPGRESMLRLPVFESLNNAESGAADLDADDVGSER